MGRLIYTVTLKCRWDSIELKFAFPENALRFMEEAMAHMEGKEGVLPEAHIACEYINEDWNDEKPEEESEE